jgi:hypothetical protein
MKHRVQERASEKTLYCPPEQKKRQGATQVCAQLNCGKKIGGPFSSLLPRGFADFEKGPLPTNLGAIKQAPLGKGRHPFWSLQAAYQEAKRLRESHPFVASNHCPE